MMDNEDLIISLKRSPCSLYCDCKKTPVDGCQDNWQYYKGRMKL